jgi:hypothetical protein
VGQVKSRFGPFGDGVGVSARYVHGLCQTYHRLSNHSGHTRWYSKVAMLKWKLVSVRLETVLLSVQDYSTVYAKRRNHFGRTQCFSWVTWVKWKLVSVCLEIVLILTQNRCTVCAERTIGLKSFWTHPIELLDDTAHVESCFDPFKDGVSFRA